MSYYSAARSSYLSWCLFWRYSIESPSLVRENQRRLAGLRRWHYRGAWT